MGRKHVMAGAVTVAALAAGTAGAVAATDDRKAAEQTVLADAAKRLGVSAADLRSALSKAESAQLDAAVEAGELTQAQADEIKRHRQDEGTVLGLGPRGHGPGGPGRGHGPGGPGHHGPGGPGHHGPGGRFLLADAAKAIGISEAALLTELRDGKDLGAVAKAHGKTLPAVKAAVKQAATSRLDADLKAGRITKAQHDAAIDHLAAELDHLGDELDHLGDELDHLGDELDHLGDFGGRGHHGPGPFGERRP